MLQVIRKEFEKLSDLNEYINNVSIKYGYLKDYKIIKENDKYNLFLNFDVPEVRQFLELARFKEQRSEDSSLAETSYKIELENKCRETGSNIYFSQWPKGFLIQGSFGFKGVFDLVKVDYDQLKDYFTIELRKFEFKTGMCGWHTYIDNILFVREVDYRTIYNHLVELIINRGYLIDKISLKELEETIYFIAKWLNRKKFHEV